MRYRDLSPKQKAGVISEILKLEYPEVSTPLHHSNAFELLVSVMLSAQTLDSYVNKVTPKLFEKYPNVDSLANANTSDIEKIIQGVNYYKTKAKHLVQMAQMLLEKFGGAVPSRMEELTTLPGVGRKTANVVINEWWVSSASFSEAPPSAPPPPSLLPKGEGRILPEGFVVDTHVKRVAKRLGLTSEEDPLKIEQDLMKIFPREEWPDMSLRLIFHGRYRCKAKNPKCKDDPVWSVICGCINK